MDALLPAFVAALLAEWGDKTQFIAALLAARAGRAAPVLAGLAAAAILSSAFAAFAGVLIGATITLRAASLLVALSLLFAGLSGLIRRGPPSIGSGRTPALVAAFIPGLAAEMGDRTQFITFAISARFDSPFLAAAGASVGIFAAAVPAALLGARFQDAVPLRTVRLGFAILFLMVGFIVAVQALRLA